MDKRWQIFNDASQSNSFKINNGINGTGAHSLTMTHDTGKIIVSNLTGVGNDYVCVNEYGVLYRNDVNCD